MKDNEIIIKAKREYAELSGIGNYTARLLRGLWEQLETALEKNRQYEMLIENNVQTKKESIKEFAIKFRNDMCETNADFEYADKLFKEYGIENKEK
jgi:hypothetical protein